MANLSETVLYPLRSLQKKLQRRLEKILESDWGPEDHPTPSSFEVESDLSSLKYLSLELPDEATARAEDLFKKLRFLFEVGLSYKKIDSPQNHASHLVTWKIEQTFINGKYFHIRKDRSPLFEILETCQTPEMRLDEVKKISFKEIFKFYIQKKTTDENLIQKQSDLDLYFHKLGIEDHSSVLIFRLTDKKLWIFISNRPEIFLKPLVIELHSTCLKIMADSLES